MSLWRMGPQLQCSGVVAAVTWPSGWGGELVAGRGAAAEGGAAPTFVTIPVMTGATCTNTATPLVPAPPSPLPLVAPHSPTDTGLPTP